MTHKQIIIDGVDVSGCKYWKGYCRIAYLCDYPGHLCEVTPNCYYKHLKRKEQSEVKLVGQIQTICDFINNRPETFKGIYGGVDKIITEYAERKEQECEELKKQYNCYACGTCKGKEDYKNLKTHHIGLRKSFDELHKQLEQLKRENEHLSEKEEEARHYLEEAEKFKNCLTEIKEIVHKSVIGGARQQILQKISECEVQND